MLNLDTHILLYALDGSLSRKERELLSSKSWGIASIVLWELDKLFELRRIKLDILGEDFKRIRPNLHIWDLSIDVLAARRKLDFNSDPADEIIAATSVHFQVPLMTRDKKILGSEVVPLA